MIGWIARHVTIQIGFGLWLSRSIGSSADFVVRDVRSGPALLAAAVFAPFFDAEAIVAAPWVVLSTAGATSMPYSATILPALAPYIFAAPFVLAQRRPAAKFAPFVWLAFPCDLCMKVNELARWTRP